MPRFAANLSMLFQEVPLLDRFAAARAAGFDAVEMLFPYDAPADRIAHALRANDLRMVLLNTPAPNWAAGDRGLAAIPGDEARFRDGFHRALHYARALDAGIIHIMAGLTQGPQARATYIDNLRWAANQAPGQRLTIEPINPHDMPRYFLNGFTMAKEIIAEVGAPNLGLQFDTYHAHKITGDMLRTWGKCRDHVVHVQVADPQGRHEPTGQTIDYPAFFARLDAEGYGGFVSGEYHPKTRTEDGLGWIH